jgi:hypothetical protein
LLRLLWERALRAGFGEHGRPKSVVLELTLRFVFVVSGTTWLILVPFLIPSDFEGVPKSTVFEKKKNEKKEVQETAMNKHDFLIDS